MKIKIKWIEERNTSNVFLISKKIFDIFKLSEQEKYDLYLGQKRKRVYLKPVDCSENCIYLIPGLFNVQFTEKDLAFFEEYRVNIWIKETSIHIGPVLGIFVKPKQLNPPPVGGSVMGHMKAGLAEGFLCYFFSIDSINWTHNMIKGYTLIPGQDEWTFAWFPLPDVIYDNKGLGHKQKEKVATKKIRKKLRKDIKIPFINILNQIGKWKTFSRLSNDEGVAHYLPMTVRYESFDQLLLTLKQHNFIFLKAITGGLGKEVMSIEKCEDQYKLIFYTNKIEELVLNSVKDLRKHINKFTKRRKFVIQRGIRLLKYQGCIFDMRILVIKDRQGKWRVMSNYARIAKENVTITNYTLGSKCDYYSNIFPYLSGTIGKSSIPTYDVIARSVLRIAEAIDQEFGNFGELGIDMGIDEYGKLWLIEVNTKPNKDLVEGLDDFENIDPQYSAIFDYVKYLVGLNGGAVLR